MSKFFGTLKNVYNFFVLYSNEDDVDPSMLGVDVNERPELDRWIISKYNSLVEEVTNDMRPTSRIVAEQIAQFLEQNGISSTVRRELGSDIDAACGQLRLKEYDSEK